MFSPAVGPHFVSAQCDIIFIWTARLYLWLVGKVAKKCLDPGLYYLTKEVEEEEGEKFMGSPPLYNIFQGSKLRLEYTTQGCNNLRVEYLLINLPPSPRTSRRPPGLLLETFMIAETCPLLFFCSQQSSVVFTNTIQQPVSDELLKQFTVRFHVSLIACIRLIVFNWLSRHASSSPCGHCHHWGLLDSSRALPHRLLYRRLLRGLRLRPE